MRLLGGLALDRELQSGGRGHLGDGLLEELARLRGSAQAVDHDVDGSARVVRDSSGTQGLVSHERVAAGAKGCRRRAPQRLAASVGRNRWPVTVQRLEGADNR